ncbi:MAG TPA: nicotinamide riboside transporter PnuC [Candidatus Tidjanibacter faecipullorum]|uniref:Nicotinamide riboside transporter PnuC n=1 Tax=Candidatus Tidjanibacter faecipullorum TaxID=2838766 RepID=A0A9D2ILP9_9BACT|nr:nicotinamide riboside transporter PnuC [Candidatus Tidjanibacter faecipullorum]
MNLLEIAGVVTGLLYLWFEYRASIWLWPVSVVMPALYLFVYYESGFYADMAINGYYLIASAYGWISWSRRRNDARPLPISRTPRRLLLPLGLVTALCFAATAVLLVRYTDSTVPYGDSFTTALSVAALWMLSRKYAEQWLVWIVVDAVSAGLYFYKGLYPTGGLYLLYAIVAVAGYFKWLKLIRQDEQTPLPDA